MFAKNSVCCFAISSTLPFGFKIPQGKKRKWQLPFLRKKRNSPRIFKFSLENVGQLYLTNSFPFLYAHDFFSFQVMLWQRSVVLTVDKVLAETFVFYVFFR